MKIVFFKRPKPKQFSYKPRYWDPEAEEFEKRKRLLDGDGETERTDKQAKEDLRSEIESRWRRRHAPEDVGRSNPWIKLFVYAIVVFFALYFIFFTGFINNLVRFFTA